MADRYTEAELAQIRRYYLGSDFPFMMCFWDFALIYGDEIIKKDPPK